MLEPEPGRSIWEAGRSFRLNRLALLLRSEIIVILLFSLILLIPCFWQARVQAGDLLSHVYNAWLTTLVEDGKVPGLYLAPQWTNIGFDVTLTSLLTMSDPRTAERIAVSASVLIFFWGTFTLVASLSHQRPWVLAPCFAILTYGWVFHAGFFNFYTSAGLACFAVAGLCQPERRKRILALAVLALSFLWHPIPGLWAGSVCGYFIFSKRIPNKSQLVLFSLAGLSLLTLRMFLLSQPESSWTWRQVLLVTGADQAAVWSRRYWLVAFVLLVLCVAALWQRTRRLAELLTDIPFQLYVLCAAGVFLLPTGMRLGKSGPWLFYIAERMSLFTAILGCTLVAKARPSKRIGVCLTLIAVLYFCFLYQDTSRMNDVENKVRELVSQIPPGQRVISLLPNPNFREADRTHTNWIEEKAGYAIRAMPTAHKLLKLLPDFRLPRGHLVDRACVEHCFSYANYEPASGHFRLRALPGNPYVVWSFEDSRALQNGNYVVKERDLPLYQIYQCGPQTAELCIRPLRAGERNGAQLLPTQDSVSRHDSTGNR